jgi:hypothetical protein
MKTRTIVPVGVVLITLLAVALGGSVYLPAQAVLAALAGLLLLVAPPRGPLPRVPLILAGLFLLLALLAFLPADDSSFTAWRHYLATQCHLPPGAPLGHPMTGPYLFPLEDTRSPQPWLTLQACALLLAGLAWGLYLLALDWKREDRILAAEMLVFGVALLALLAALAFIFHFRIPGWEQTENRGWFPNRNQTADVLALTGIAAYALIFDRLRKGKRTGYLLLLGLVPIVLELVISYSRAGILLFFGGVLAWHLWPRPGVTRWRSGSIKWLTLSVALGIILLAIFLAFGGATLSRFLEPAPANAATQDITDYRGAIQADALRFSLESPFLGAGLGNFEPLFSFSRVDSINGNRAIHPESDWLWLAGEMGWLAVALVAAAYVWWMRRVLPLENRPGESMRRALVVAGLVFAVHGFVDVSAHRPGSLWVALLILGLAVPARAELRPSRATPVVFRSLGIVLLAIAVWWGGSLRGWDVPPTTATLARLKQRVQNGLPPAAAIGTADEALRIAPLDWSLYLQRGRAETADPKTFDLAAQDFSTADALNPYWIALPIDEGNAWIDANEPGLAVDAWTGGLKRAGPLAPEEFREMAGLAPEHSIMREGLVALALAHLDDLLTVLPTANYSEARALIVHLLQTDPQLTTLTPQQRHELFSAWWARGSKRALIELVRQHPEWDSETWVYQAGFAALKFDFQGACDICARWARPPVVPRIGPDRPIGDLASTFQANPDNLSDGLELFLAQIQEGQTDDALATLAALRHLPGPHPAYLSYLEAQLDTRKSNWPAAWSAWQDFLQP